MRRCAPHRLKPYAKTGDKAIGLTARILLIASAGSVNGQPASNEKRT